MFIGIPFHGSVADLASLVIHSDPVLIARLERAEAELQRRWAEAVARTRSFPAAWTDLPCGGVAVDKGPDVVWSRAYTLALGAEPVARDEVEDAVDQAEVFFAAHGKPARIDLGPTADPTLMAVLRERRYSVVMYDTILAMTDVQSARTHTLHAHEPRGSVVIQRARDMRAWAERLVESFVAGGPPEDVHDGMVEKLAGFEGVEGVTCLDAIVDGEPAGGSFIAVIDGVALLHSAGTLPAYRGRGVQRALLVERARIAHEAGAEFLCAQADSRNAASLRNMERFGLRPCCSRVTVEAPGA
ncbi:MAG: GNAT family N-acetyltransferase [Planctomycetota bacterium]